MLQPSSNVATKMGDQNEYKSNKYTLFYKRIQMNKANVESQESVIMCGCVKMSAANKI